LNKYRLKSKNHQLKFKDGEIIELFSASDLFSKGFIGSVTEYRDDNYYEGTIFSFDEKTKEVYIYENSNKKNLEAKIPASVFYIINDKPVSREEYMKHLQQTENKK
jgi:hypothetical protein